VRFLGPAPHAQIPEILAGLDVFVLSSDWEGLPVALVEAASSGAAIVATDVGSVSEVVENGVSGRLVPPRRPDMLAAEILRLVKDPGERRALGAGARDRAETRFDIRRLAERTAAMYEGLLDERLHAARPRADMDRPSEHLGAG
jgi:glycosyltransferase involved in cell wall biosynthesis